MTAIDTDNDKDQKHSNERDNAEMYQHIREAKQETKQVKKLYY